MGFFLFLKYTFIIFTAHHLRITGLSTASVSVKFNSQKPSNYRIKSEVLSALSTRVRFLCSKMQHGSVDRYERF
jgi:hypothetical protein